MNIVRAPYCGPSRKLVVALDIGTTFSGAAYALLEPGQIPETQFVTRYLNTPNLGSAKVPSILYYDQDGNFRGVENGVDFQDDDEFLSIRWWKLRLSPIELPAAMKNQISTEFPKGKTIDDVFADFMGYLFDSAKKLFKDSVPNGEVRWDTVSNDIELVLTHPNGWGGPQQTRLRTAAIKAGIVPDTPTGHSSVHFLTEGEASFNFCATDTKAVRDIKPGEQVLIIDAGGGTIDISTYTILDNRPLQVEELYEPECLVQGGEFVTARAREMVKEKWKDSKFDNDGDLSAFSQKFDEGVKRVFSNDQTPQHVKFGSMRDNDLEYGIKAGRFTLTGSEVAGLFEPSIQSIVDCIKDKFSQQLITNSFVFLIGGFGTSPWLSQQLEKRLSGLGLKFCKPDVHTNKAVAVGAVSYYVDHFVTGRVSRFTYGTPCSHHYLAFDPEHVRRERKAYFDFLGRKLVSDGFIPLLLQGTKVLEDHEVRQDFCYVTEGTPQRYAHQSVVKYTGTHSDPQWMDVEQENFETLCYIQADLSTAPSQIRRGNTGQMCYMREFEVILLVGLTELKAQIGWIDSVTGKEKRSDAVVVYDDPSQWTT